MQIEQQPELRVFLADIVDKQTPKDILDDRMRELENLVNTYWGVVVLQKYQKKDFPDHKTYVWKDDVTPEMGVINVVWRNYFWP